MRIRECADGGQRCPALPQAAKTLQMIEMRSNHREHVMRRESFLALFVPAVLIALSATPAFSQATYTVVPDSTVTSKPAPDTATPGSTDQSAPAAGTTAPASNGSSSAAPPLIPPDADPTAPGLTPEQRKAASEAHRAHVKAVVAAAQARVAAAKEKLAAQQQAAAAGENATPSPDVIAARKALVDANKARLAADKAKRQAYLDQINNLHADDPTSFTPDHENLNKSSYQAMFQMDAFTALNQALAIQARTTHPTLTPSESALFQAIHSGQGGRYSFAEAALIASGVDDVNKRKVYLDKISQIVAKNKEQTDKEKWLVDKAGDIIGYLIAVPMKNGYDDDTYSLAQVLDTGHFNCISSVVMFVAVAHGVGLEAGAVVEPSHIVARIPGYDVQTTSGRIFATNFRLKDIQDQKYTSEEMNKFDPDHPYHEVGDYGILMEIYQNIANQARDNKQGDQAAIGALKEVFLDPTMPCAGHDLKVFLNDWFNASTTRKDITTAAAIAKLYRQMSRDPAAANEMDQCVVNLKQQLAKH
jgi:hypothetical protein